jgi:multisubunit Na+/H+ antiporter MnhC subunit
MNSPLAIVLTAIVLVAVSTLAIMNSACKSSRHDWCAPTTAIPHHLKVGS